MQNYDPHFTDEEIEYMVVENIVQGMTGTSGLLCDSNLGSLNCYAISIVMRIEAELQ